MNYYKIHTNRTRKVVNIIHGNYDAVDQQRCIHASNCTFVVNENGLARFHRTKHRTVFAYILAESYAPSTLPQGEHNYSVVSFNPFENETFVSNGLCVTYAQSVFMYYDLHKCIVLANGLS